MSKHFYLSTSRGYPSELNERADKVADIIINHKANLLNTNTLGKYIGILFDSYTDSLKILLTSHKDYLLGLGLALYKDGEEGNDLCIGQNLFESAIREGLCPGIDAEIWHELEALGDSIY